MTTVADDAASATAGVATPASQSDDVVVGSDWTTVCPAAKVGIDRGVAAIVDGEPVAIFRLSPAKDGDAEEWRAVSHIDPATGSPVMARGLVGSVGSGLAVVPTVASPLHKQRYNLRSGYCLDDDALRLTVYEVRVVGGVVECRPGDGAPPSR